MNCLMLRRVTIEKIFGVRHYMHKQLADRRCGWFKNTYDIGHGTH